MRRLIFKIKIQLKSYQTSRKERKANRKRLRKIKQVLLDDIIKFIPLGNGLIQTDLQRRLCLRPAGGKHLQTDGFSIHENDLTFIIRSLAVAHGEKLALAHTQGKGNMSGIVSSDLKNAAFRLFGQQEKSRHT